MKIWLSILFVCLAIGAKAQSTLVKDTCKQCYVSIEASAEYPGGLSSFYRFIVNNLRYREVEQLIGIKGRVVVSFVVEKDGGVTSVTSLSDIGEGCEQEVVNIVSHSSLWKPAEQNGKRVKQPMTIPVSFNFPKDSIILNEFRKAKGGYLFQVKDKILTINDVAAVLGESFPASKVEKAILYTGDNKFNLKNKKEIYLIKIKAD